MLIEVTAEDIEKGERDDRFCCPIALATIRATKGDRASVSDTVITAYLPEDDERGECSPTLGRRLRWATPAVARTFINAFDDGEAVRPFAFDLDDEPTIPWYEAVATP